MFSVASNPLDRVMCRSETCIKDTMIIMSVLLTFFFFFFFAVQLSSLVSIYNMRIPFILYSVGLMHELILRITFLFKT